MFDVNGDFAEFEFYGNAERAIGQPDALIFPFCEYEGDIQNASQIDTKAFGKLLKDGDSWRVSEKTRLILT
jgi:hypothetical protein